MTSIDKNGDSEVFNIFNLLDFKKGIQGSDV